MAISASPAKMDTMTQDDARHPVALADPKLRAWRAFLHAHVAVMHELESQLVSRRGMTLAEYDALVQLAGAPGAHLRMGELAERVLLSRSGLTRLVDRLVAQGLVRREHCGSDARGSYAALTREGVRQLREAMPVHLAGIAELFMDVVDDADAEVIERAMTAVAATAGHPVRAARRAATGAGSDGRVTSSGEGASGGSRSSGARGSGSQMDGLQGL